MCVGADGKFLEQAKSYLERTADVQVHTATSPQDALVWMRSERCDAIVCDHRPPAISGLDFLGGLRASGMDVPFVLLTEEDRQEILVRAMHLNADFCLQTTWRKEYVLPELNHRLRQAMEKHEEERRLHHRLAMEELVTDISKRMLAARPEAIGDEVQDALRRVGEFLGARRCFLNLISPDRSRIVESFDWPEDLLPIQHDDMHSLDPTRYSWALDKFARGESIIISDLDALPPEVQPEIKSWRKLGIRHAAGLPLISNGTLKGFFGFTSIGDPNEWTEDDVGLMVILSQSVSAGLERKEYVEELRQEKEKFRAIADYTCNMEMWVGTDGEVRWLNPAVEKITGYTVAECMRVPGMLLPMVVEEDRPLIAEWQKKGEMGQSMSDQEFRIRRKDGELRYVAVSWQPIFDSHGGSQGHRISARDVTDRKKVEEALQQSFAQLTTLNRVTRHDMAAQIAVLRKEVELCQSSTDAKMERLLERMAGTVSELERQLQFMEDYQQLGAKEPMWQNVSEVASSVLERMVLPTRVKVKLDLGDLEVFADPMLEKVFASLVDNSLLHGGGVRDLRMHSLATDDSVSIVYQDDGKGIPDEEKLMLFQSRYNKRPALGLLLCRSILEVTGIEICENGAPGKGARFELLVPAGFFRFPPAEER